jgi:hypothetical protein
MPEVKIDKVVKVKPGDCISSLASEYGFLDWRSLYQMQKDAFKKDRENPNSLNVGDEVQIPHKDNLTGQKGTGGSHVFTVVKPKPVKLRLVLIDHANKQLADKPYTLLLGGQHKSAKTNAQGLIELEISPKVTHAQLNLDLTPPKVAPAPPPAKPPAPKTPPYPAPIVPADFKDHTDKKPPDHLVQWSLAIGSLPSVNSDSGVEARLHNLGFHAVGGHTRVDLVKAYQKKKKLSETGKASDIQNDIKATHDKL